MAGARNPDESRALRLLGPLCGLVVVVWLNLSVQPWTIDDAYISFRYAENFARGEGLVYNPGELVEGYTTFLWVFLIGIGNALGADSRGLAKVLGPLFTVATVLLVSRAHRFHRAIPATGAAIAATLLGGSAMFGVWAMTGMEVPLVAFLLTLATLCFLRDAWLEDAWVAAGVSGALALMTRPDSIVVLAVLCAGAAWRAVGARDPRPLRAPLVLAGLYGPYFAWRFFTYGWLLPNTFYAKVGSSEAQIWRGLGYVGDFVEPSAPLWMPALLLVPLGWTAWQRYGGLAVLWLAVGLQGLYVVAVGGDVMPAFRFFAGTLPIFALTAGLALALLPRLGWGFTLLALLFGPWEFERHPDLHKRIERGVVGNRGEEVGLWMRDHLPRGVVATNTAGSVPYFSGFVAIDMLGLNDAHIAHKEMPNMGGGRAGHEKADGAYVLARDPDYVHMGSARGSDKPVFRSDRELFRQPGFRERYVLRTYRLESGGRLHLWVKRALVDAGAVP